MPRFPSARRHRQTPRLPLLLLCAVIAYRGESFQYSSPGLSRRSTALLASRKAKTTNGKKKEPCRATSSKDTSASGNAPDMPSSATEPKKKRTLRYQNVPGDELLSAKEEQALGKKIRKAIALKEELRNIIEEKEATQFERYIKEQEYRRRITSDLLYDDFNDREEYDEDFDGLSIEGLDYDPSREIERSRDELESNIKIQFTEDYVDDVAATSGANSFFSKGPGNQVLVSDEDLAKIGIAGGRKEVSRILIEGAMARDKLMNSNVRLVFSIARKWCQISGKKSGDPAAAFQSGWGRPGLDEAVQEGMIGLATAADRFDYKRKLRFSTYATYWITNYVRRCFDRAVTGSLRIPDNYHQMRQRYEKLVSSHYKETGGERVPLNEAAQELGLKPERLELMLRLTEPLAALDAPISSSVMPMSAGKAGGTDSMTDVTLGHMISCPDPVPEERVEMSFLRQCLENAMSTELSPHERDIVRIRYGLDDGTSRTAKETSEMLTLSVSDVRKAENSAFRKLRSPYSVHTYNLLGFLDYLGAEPDEKKMPRRPKRFR